MGKSGKDDVSFEQLSSETEADNGGSEGVVGGGKKLVVCDSLCKRV